MGTLVSALSKDQGKKKVGGLTEYDNVITDDCPRKGHGIQSLSRVDTNDDRDDAQDRPYLRYCSVDTHHRFGCQQPISAGKEREGKEWKGKERKERSR